MCIEEEQYEAKKLDIMRDAFKATSTYKTETQKVAGTPRGDSILVEDDPASPRESTPDVVGEIRAENGAVILLENGNRIQVENGIGSTHMENENETIENGNGAVVVENGNGASNGAENGDGSVPTEVPAE